MIQTCNAVQGLPEQTCDMKAHHWRGECAAWALRGCALRGTKAAQAGLRQFLRPCEWLRGLLVREHVG